MRGVLLRPIGGVGGDDIEQRPVNALERNRGVAHWPAESRADNVDGAAQEVVHARADLADHLPHAERIGKQREPLLERVTGEEALRKQAHLRASEHDDVRAILPQSLGALGAVGE